MSEAAQAGSVVATPAGNPAQSQAPAVVNGSPTAGTGSWLDGLSEGNRKLAETKGWTTSGDANVAITSYAELERQQGQALRVPGDDAKPEEWDKFREKLPPSMRRPETAEKYELKRPEGLPEGLPYDDDMAKAFKGIAFEAGLPPSAADKLHSWYAQDMGRRYTAFQENLATQINEAGDNIVKAWGPSGSEGNAKSGEMANRAVEHYGLQKVLEDALLLVPAKDGSGHVWANAEVAKAFADIGQNFVGEDRLEGGRGVQGGDNPFKRDPKTKQNAGPDAISALIASDPERAKRLAREVGEYELWFPDNPR